MASRSVSPGGALLRASRIFSIPPALPRPAGDLSSTAVFNSDTATLPHPIHLSITTPQSSLVRGDWGFKRPLPLRSTTKTSTPFIRVEAIDTFEHITEFGSSADHALTLQKWQELDVPLSTPPTKERESNLMHRNKQERSVFEDDIDSTTQSERGSLRIDDARWKFKGPWLAGQTEGQFNEYVQKEVRRRKGEFHQFLRASCANALTREAQRKASGEEESLPIFETSAITEAQLTEYIKSLRQDHTELYKQIRTFLDLPPSPSSKFNTDALLSELTLGAKSASFKPEDALPVSMSPYAETGPPKTHPSAGLAYSRTSQHLHNHPVYGPQRNKPPVQARVVMPKGAAVGNFAPALGVGGFVTDVPAGDNSFDVRGFSQRNRTGMKNASRGMIPGLLNIEPDKQGGSKAWVHPKSASVDPKGRVILTVIPGDEEAVAVREGKADNIPKPDLGGFKKGPVGTQTMMRTAGLDSRSNGNWNGGYGLSVGGSGNDAARPAAKRDGAAFRELSGLLNGGEN